MRNSNPSDDELMTALAEGNGQALESLRERHIAWVRSLILEILDDPDAADDLSQELFLRIYEKRADYRPSGAFTNWVGRIARNLALNEAKRRGLVRFEALEEERDGSTIGVSFPGFRFPKTPLEAMEREELAHQVRDAVASLPAVQRIPLVMRHYGGMTYKDIAWALGCPEGTVKSRVFQALGALRSRLEPILEEVRPRMKCEEARQLLPDLFYEEISDKKKEELGEHLRLCSACRAERKALKRIFDSLAEGKAEPNQRLMVIEPDEEQNLLVRAIVWGVNGQKEPLTETPGAGIDRHIVIEALKDAKGRDLPFTIAPRDGSNLEFKARFHEPVQTGERFGILLTGRLRGVVRWPNGTAAAGIVSEPEGRKTFQWWDEPGYAALAIHAFRLPAGARVEEVDPQPDEIIPDADTRLLVWETRLGPKDHFECRVVYEMMLPAA